MQDQELLSELIKLETEMTFDVMNGHKPLSEDKYKQHRIRVWELRNQLNLNIRQIKWHSISQ
jgi:hypothetical protein